MEKIWKRDRESEDDLDIRYRSGSDDEGPQTSPQYSPAPTGNNDQPEVITSDDSENMPLALAPRNRDSPQEAKQLKATNKVRPTGEPIHQRPITRNTRSENKATTGAQPK